MSSVATGNSVRRPLEAPRVGWLSGERYTTAQWLCDVVELTKPRITAMVLVTVAVAGFVAAWGQPDMWRLLHAVVGTALVAAGSSAANQWLERRSDARMARTCRRPLAACRLGIGSAWVLIAMTTCIGTWYLYRWTSPQTAAWALATWLGYVGVYTPLKRVTSLNTAIGAVVGALPVVVGWTAVGAPFNHRLLALFLMLFLWQFPHFMAIAWLYRDDYRRAGLRMLTVTDPSGEQAGCQAVLCCLALLPVSFLPALVVRHPVVVAYLLASLLLGTIYLVAAVSFRLQPSARTARWLLRMSLIYLPVMLGLLAALACTYS